MAKDKVKKVGGASAPAAQAGKEKGKKEKKERPVFKIAEAVDDKGKSVVNDDGALTAMPHNYVVGQFKPLKKEDFADKGVAMAYRAAVMQHRGEKFLKVAADLRTGAANFAKFGDDKAAKKVKKLAKMREQYAALQKELAEEGVTIEDEIAPATKE